MNINIKKLFCLFLLFFSFSLIAKEDHRVEIQPIAFEKALSIANQGVLKQKENEIKLNTLNTFLSIKVDGLRLLTVSLAKTGTRNAL